MKRLIFLLPAFLIVFSNCKMEEKPVSSLEAITVKNIIDSCIKIKRPAEFNKLFSARLLAESISKKQKKKLGSSFIKGVSTALSNASMGQQIMSSIKDNGSYEMVKHYEKDSKQHLIYRLYADGSLNYHDFELGRSKGKVYIADMFIYVSGEELSETIADLAENFSDNNMAGEKDFTALRKMKQLLTEGKHKQAKDIYDRLPTDLKDQRSLQIMHILICSGLDEEIYMGAIDKFIKLFPDEPYMFLMMIDACMMKKDYTGAIRYIDKTDSVINKDPFLDYYRGLLYKAKGDEVNATMHFETVSKNMPHFADGILALIEQYLEDGKTDKAKETILLYRGRKEFEQESLTFLLYSYPDFKE